MTDAPPVRPTAKPRKQRKLLLVLLVLGAVAVPVLTVLGAVALALGIRVGAAEAFEIEGPAMAPDYQQGDRVVVDKRAYGLFLPFSERASTTWDAPSFADVAILRTTDGIDVIKRVVGLPGDEIAFEGGRLVRNGQPLPLLAGC